MKYVALSFVLIISLLILIVPVSAENLHTDIIKKFFPITGAVIVDIETNVTPVEEPEYVPPVEEKPKEVCPELPPCTCPDGTLCPSMVDEKGCGYWGECPPVGEGCPELHGCLCPDGSVCPGGKDAQGCPIWLPDKCPVEDICPPLPVALCGEGPYAATCIPEPCPPDMIRITKYDERGCAVGTECVPKIRNQTIDCPESQTCPDGSTVPCYIKDNNCICDLCTIPGRNIPEGCWQEVNNETGTTNIVCGEKTCIEIPRIKEMADECAKAGGNPKIKTNANGCDYLDCLFGETDPNPIDGYEQCPSQEEIEISIIKCKDAGMHPAISFEGGCKVVRCKGEEQEICKVITAEMRLRIEEECAKKGLKAIKDFDESGCPYFACAGEEFCKMGLTGNAFEKCNMKGGEMVIKRDGRGCIIYSECIERGDQKNIYVDPMEKVPEAAELLSVAFKLEQLKVELDRLARQADDIADYYASVGNSEEHRFRRVSSMFNSIKDKIDEIKNNLRDRIDSLTPEDMEHIRFDIKSVKESLKDIVYVMLSNSDDVKEMIEYESASPEIPVEGEDCGTDNECFERALRICKPITVMPEGRAGPIVIIKGLKESVCIIHVQVPEGASVPPEYEGREIYMDCKLAKYSLGIIDPEKDILPYCEGPMKELMEKYGEFIESGKPQGPEEFKGPGGCESDKECKEYCDKDPKACLGWCESSGQCTPEAIEDLKQSMIEKEVPFCGNGICESEFESSETCLSDCIREGEVRNEFNNEEQFLINARNIGPVITIDFETLPDGTQLYDGIRLNGEEYSSLGVRFHALSEDYLQAFGPHEPFRPIGGLSLSPGNGPFTPPDDASKDDLDMKFTTLVSAVGFYILDSDETDYRESVKFYDREGRVINTMPLETRGMVSFVGFISSVGISKVRVLENAYDGDDVAYDNIHFVRMEGEEVEVLPKEELPEGIVACVGCFNNGICDVGECSECVDCLQR